MLSVFIRQSICDPDGWQYCLDVVLLSVMAIQLLIGDINHARM